MDLDTVRNALASAGLTPLLPHLDALAWPAIRLTTTPADEATLAVGVSKLGGQPDLPANTTWPEKQGAPLSFVAQVRLADAHPFDVTQSLQSTGLLSYFYDGQQATYGTDPADRDGWRVFSFDAASGQLQRRPLPQALPATARFKPCTVAYSQILTLAQQPALEIPGLSWTPDMQRTYEGATSSLTDNPAGAPQHQLLGHPNTLQDDMRIQCQLAANGVSMANAASDPRTAALSAGAAGWRLLFQVDSDNRAGIRWPDSGMLYYWIERAALARHDVGNVWAVLQSE
ncbi:MAG TPA: YwqG family protein [Ktedonobacterales bacterium]|nr:YwqG family protein [Ktedonobacterales bacterium]